jgi:hypothetical protein
MSSRPLTFQKDSMPPSSSTKTPDAQTPDVQPVAVTAPSATVDQATFLAAVDLLIKQQGMQQAQGLTAEQLDKILTNNAASVQKALKPENASAPNVSVYNPDGGPKAKLTYTNDKGETRARKTYFVGARMDEDLLTPLEIALFNRFTASKTAKGGLWTATIKQNGNDQELHVFVPHKELDDRMGLGSLTMILRELLEGPDAANPDALIARLEAAEARIAAMTAA